MHASLPWRGPSRRVGDTDATGYLGGLAFEPEADTAAAAQSLLRPVPTPGYFYRIRKGDSLLGVAGRAYGVGAGARRLDLARRINRHPLNRPYLLAGAASRLFPEGLISFFPRWACGGHAPGQPGQDAPRGSCFAIIYIPAGGLRHSLLGALTDVPMDYLLARLAAAPGAVRDERVPGQDWETYPPAAMATAAGLEVVEDPRRSPFRFICSLFSVAPFPGKPHLALIVGPATGTLIGHRHLLTAAHVLYDDMLGDGSKLFEARVVFVTPAADSPHKHSGLPDTPLGYSPIDLLLLQASPLGHFSAPKMRFDPRFAGGPPEHRHLYDYAVLKTSRSIGHAPWRRGRYGHWNSSHWGSGTLLVPQKPRALLQGRTVHLSGYPTAQAERYGPSQLHGRGAVDNAALGPLRRAHSAGRERIGYEIPTLDGHSGAPVWRTFRAGGRTVRTLTAVHSRRLDIASGVLLTPVVYRQILSWMRAM
jgi:hypothetical protein